MKRLAALLALLWSLANLVVVYWFLTSAFTAQTAAKEGPMAQASLLLGGLLIGTFAVILARQCVRILAAPEEASGA